MSVLLLEEIKSEAVRKAVAQASGSWYVILDACDAPNVLALVGNLLEEQESKPENPPLVQSLYSGKAASDYHAIAPYLFSLSAELIEWILAELDGQSWGFLFQTKLDFKSARKHFRGFLTVLDPQGEKMLFRFYDPRVLKIFLESSSQQEIQTFFGPCSLIVIPESGKFLSLCPSTAALEISR